MSSWFTMMMDMKTSCERVGLDVDVVYRGDGHGDEYVIPMAAVDSKGSRVKDEPCVSSYKSPLRVTQVGSGHRLLASRTGRRARDANGSSGLLWLVSH
jgi:hypothetical protein